MIITRSCSSFLVPVISATHHPQFQLSKIALVQNPAPAPQSCIYVVRAWTCTTHDGWLCHLYPYAKSAQVPRFPSYGVASTIAANTTALPQLVSVPPPHNFQFLYSHSLLIDLKDNDLVPLDLHRGLGSVPTVQRFLNRLYVLRRKFHRHGTAPITISQFYFNLFRSESQEICANFQSSILWRLRFVHPVRYIV